MPLIARDLSGIIGLFIGRLIDNTRTAQGKARPWILLSVFGLLAPSDSVIVLSKPNVILFAYITFIFHRLKSNFYGMYVLINRDIQGISHQIHRIK